MRLILICRVIISIMKAKIIIKRLLDGIEATTQPASDEQIRNSRHAYYANVSYFDSKVGELVRTIEEDSDLITPFLSSRLIMASARRARSLV